MQLDPKVLMTIKDLPLLAKTVIDGFLTGFNKSSLKGPGLEFSQYRSYQPGDDLRWLDWRMYARSDRYYIRESETETSISVRFLIDASASMAHEDNGITKINYARFLAASLAYLSNLHGDAVGLYAFKESGLFSLSAKADPLHLQRLFYQLSEIETEGKFTKPIHYRELYTGSSRKELLVFITDMYQETDEIDTLLNSLAGLKHELIVFQLMGQNELELDFKGYAALEDLETGEVVQIDPKQAKVLFKEKLSDHLTGLRLKLTGRNIYHKLINTSQPLDVALRDFLIQRDKGH